MTATTDTPRRELNQPEDIDAQRIALALRDGSLDETAARWQIAEIVYSSTVPGDVASGWLARTYPTAVRRAQRAADLGEALTALLVNKIMGLTTGGEVCESKFDVTQLADGASLRGWMRNFSDRAAISEHRNLVRSTSHESTYGTTFVPCDGENDGDDGASDTGEDGRYFGITKQMASDFDFATAADPTATSATCTTTREGFDAALATFERDAHKARPIARKHIAAKALCEGMSLPTPRRMRSTTDRVTLQYILAEDPNAPARVVAALADGSDDLCVADELICEVFGDYSQDDFTRLADMNYLIPATLAISVATPTLMPTSDNCRALREAAVVGVPKAHRSAVTATVNRWLAANAEAIGTEYGIDSNVIDKDDTQLATDLAAYEIAATKLAKVSKVLGTDAVSIASALARMLERVNSSELVAS